MNAVLQAALAFHRAGCSVVPVAVDGSKAPLGRWKRYQSQRMTDAEIRGWFEGGHDGIGVVTGAVSGDLELLEFEGRAVTEGVFAEFTALTGPAGLGDAWKQVAAGYFEQTPSGGLHLLYRIAGRVPGNTKLARRRATAAELVDSPHDKIKVLIETRGEGGFVVVAPSHGSVHPRGKPWRLLTGAPDTITTITAEQHQALHQLAVTFDRLRHVEHEPTSPLPFGQPSSTGGDTTDGVPPGDDYEARTDWADILRPHGWQLVHTRGATRYWRRPGKKLGVSATTGAAGDRDRIYVFSTSTEFDPETPYTKFGAYAVLEHGGDHTLAAKTLRAAGYGRRPAKPPRAAGRPRTSPPAATENTPPVGVPAIPRTHLEWGLTLARDIDWLRHVHGIGWHVWNGTRWRPDDDATAILVYTTEVKKTWTKLADINPDDRRQAFQNLLSAERKTSSDGALHFASCQPEMSIAASRMDQQKRLVNSIENVLNIAGDTGITVQEHRKEDLITKIANGSWDPERENNTEWSEFVSQILPDTEIRGFVHRLMGSSLDGHVRDHILPIFVGTGANGKTTFVESVLWAMGDYGMTANPQLLMASKHDQHPTSQAALRGLRLVICTETEEGRRLNAALVKRLTGGDTIRARYMGKDEFEFEPQHTIIMVTNHKPIVPASDDALWRRLAVVPFEQKFEGRREIKNLTEQFKADPDAVFSWMAAGLKEYQKRGLDTPDAVHAETKAYRRSSDTIGAFLEERTWPAERGQTQSSALFDAWRQWCSGNGEEAGTQKAFSDELTQRGHEKGVSAGRRFWKGFNLLTCDDATGGEGW